MALWIEWNLLNPPRFSSAGSADHRTEYKGANLLNGDTNSKAGPLVVVTGMSKNFGSLVALDEVSFALGAGEIVGLIGPNGAGKTTTMRILTGMETVFRGRVTISGLAQPERRENILGQIAYLPQDVAFAPWRTAAETLDLLGRLSGLDTSQLWTKIPEILGAVGLGDKVGVRVGTFSRGMKQRLGMAQAMLAEPRLMILDEPFNHLDPAGRQHLKQLMIDINKKGTTILFSSHILADVEEMMQRLVVLRCGQVVFDGTVDELKSKNGDANRVEIGYSGVFQPLDDLTLVEGLESLQQSAPNILRLCASADADLDVVLTRALNLLIQRGLLVRYVKRIVPSLESIVGRMTEGLLDEEGVA